LRDKKRFKGILGPEGRTPLGKNERGNSKMIKVYELTKRSVSGIRDRASAHRERREKKVKNSAGTAGRGHGMR